MESISFIDIESGEPEIFYVLEQTVLNEVEYLLVSSSEDDDAEVMILKRTGEEDGDSTYEWVVDEDLQEVLLPIFQELFDEDEE
ncbi:MAG: DUF1292 domain-containing protein [Lachnospiraceae bacterium]|nr:DUF1292 domain-containing protein [Lachnospiraceae bacterium]